MQHNLYTKDSILHPIYMLFPFTYKFSIFVSQPLTCTPKKWTCVHMFINVNVRVLATHYHSSLILFTFYFVTCLSYLDKINLPCKDDLILKTIRPSNVWLYCNVTAPESGFWSFLLHSILSDSQVTINIKLCSFLLVLSKQALL